jgi:predicted lipoprotein with Yx(FWY)xxD motif
MQSSTFTRWLKPILLTLGLSGLIVAPAAVFAADDVVSVTNDATLGSILADGNGMTLYVWDRDEAGQANVTTAAPAVWPPFIVSAAPTGANGLGTAMRSDGTLQATAGGRPLYFFANDTAAGETKGQGVGNSWWVVSAGAMDEMMATTDMVMASETAKGLILTDAAGMSLYTWDRDDPTAMTITTTASASWPLYLVSDVPMAPAGLPGMIGAAPRHDGGMQGTFNGWPLYYYVNDKAAGDTNGDGVGGIWHLIALSNQPTAAPAEVPGVSPSVATVGTTSHPTRGQVLTDGNGRSVYVLNTDRDNNNMSVCYEADGCTEIWPPVLVSGNPVAPTALSGQLGTQARSDATTQLSYDGRPLYYFVGDQKPGDFTGDSIRDQWGGWFLVAVD